MRGRNLGTVLIGDGFARDGTWSRRRGETPSAPRSSSISPWPDGAPARRVARRSQPAWDQRPLRRVDRRGQAGRPPERRPSGSKEAPDALRPKSLRLRAELRRARDQRTPFPEASEVSRLARPRVGPDRWPLPDANRWPPRSPPRRGPLAPAPRFAHLPTTRPGPHRRSQQPPEG